jgi:perosamine synthetase
VSVAQVLCLVWADRPYLADDFDTPNARSIRDRSFNLYLNEKYGEQESKDCVKAIVKVEKYFKIAKR